MTKHIISVVAKAYHVTPTLLTKSYHDAVITIPRQICFYFFKRYTNLPEGAMGEEMGVSRQSVRNALGNINRYMQVDPEFAALVIKLDKKIRLARRKNVPTELSDIYLKQGSLF